MGVLDGMTGGLVDEVDTEGYDGECVADGGGAMEEDGTVNCKESSLRLSKRFCYETNVINVWSVRV